MIDGTLTSAGTRDATSGIAAVDRDKEFQRVLTEFGPALARFSLGYELDPENRRDLLQEIHSPSGGVSRFSIYAAHFAPGSTESRTTLP